jgi:glycosyltransferase involved in cell wall biosynthesis
MKIAILNLTRGTVSGGYGKYLRTLVPLLRARPDVDRLDVFVPPQMVEDGLETWPADDELRGFRRLRERIRTLRPDVVFIPTARALVVDAIPVVTMVRNMEPLEVPFGGNTLKEGLKNLARAAAARYACHRATRVIAVSGHVKEFLERRWRINPERVGLVYHGVDAPPSPRMPEAVRALGAQRFLFTAGSIRPARGLADLIGALADPVVSGDLVLVIGGSTDPGTERHKEHLQALAVQNGVAERVIWAGKLDAAEMSWSFRNCAAFVMTSRAEACPNTALEAMSHGALSISGDNPPMPEFFRDTATYYRAGDASSLARAIAGVLSASPAQIEGWRASARTRASEFTWSRTVEGTLAELRKARQP